MGGWFEAWIRLYPSLLRLSHLSSRLEPQPGFLTFFPPELRLIFVMIKSTPARQITNAMTPTMVA
jgi:hypothetical protein